MTLLDVRDLWVDRLGQPVVRGVDLGVAAGEITVLLGSNGVGKSTLLDGISAVAPARVGTISLGDNDMTRASTRLRVRHGLAYVQQGRAIFPTLTVEENFEVVAKKPEFGRVLELFPELVPRLNSRTELLSGGEQQMVVLARALLQKPRVLMIDELSLGLAPIVVTRLLHAVRQLADEGLGVLLVEQFANQALAVGDQALVMNRGEIVLRRPSSTLLAAPEELRTAYFGTVSP